MTTTLRAALTAALLLATGAAHAAQLTVTVTGLRDDAGDVRVVLYDRADAFRHEDRAAAIKTMPAGKLEAVVFDALAPGRYAVIAYQDANRNGKLDLFLGMFPAEGWGMSNDPAVIGPPAFDPAAVTVPDAGAAITVGLHY
jgi:uncharacterized protein (DUF2141 family)